MAALMAFALELSPVALPVHLYYLLPSIWLDTVDHPKFGLSSCHVKHRIVEHSIPAQFIEGTQTD